MKWTSGALGSAIDVRGGDLLSVLLVPTGRGASSEAPVVGRPPCWKYSPKRAVGKVRDRPFLARGEGADELYYEHDLSPFWVPDPGTVWLQGGIGVEYASCVTAGRQGCLQQIGGGIDTGIRL